MMLAVQRMPQILCFSLPSNLAAKLQLLTVSSQSRIELESRAYFKLYTELYLPVSPLPPYPASNNIRFPSIAIV